MELIIQKQPESSTFSGHSVRASSSLSSCASSGSEPDTEPDAHWDSGEPLYPFCPRCAFYEPEYSPDSPCMQCDDGSLGAHKCDNSSDVDIDNADAVTDTNLCTKTQQCFNIEHEASHSDDSCKSVDVDDELFSNNAPHNTSVVQDPTDNDNDLFRNNHETNTTSMDTDTKPVYDDVCETLLPVNSEACRKASFAGNVEDNKNMYIDKFELPLKSEYEYDLHMKHVKDPYQSFNKSQYVSDGNNECPVDKSKHPVNIEKSIKGEPDNTHNKQEFPLEISEPEFPDSIVEPLDYTDANKGSPLSEPEYLDGTNMYPGKAELPQEYPVDGKKNFKSEEISKKDKKCRYKSRTRLALVDMRASWKEFSGKFGENRKKKHKDDRQ